ncbi:hypothetical protein XELAEV_18001970mg [Xenopus laevis]|uniref:Uncharacterized protein n=1 Tax=Xenopus laevis TaxID=8355 RepID=A0A974BP23_XENLA|nr:hypothetical protein XELAEV_18001970mg [Xenopus laevis]
MNKYKVIHCTVYFLSRSTKKKQLSFDIPFNSYKLTYFYIYVHFYSLVLIINIPLFLTVLQSVLLYSDRELLLLFIHENSIYGKN